MWLESEKAVYSVIKQYRQTLFNSCPNHIVLDGLFNEKQLDKVVSVLQDPSASNWQTQKHTYSALYVDDQEWQSTNKDQRFVQRDVWLRQPNKQLNNCIAHDFLSFLRGDEFMSFLSQLFDTHLTDLNVGNPSINTNYFRLSSDDFVQQHADESPGREVCMLLYLNKDWDDKAGGELCFEGASSEVADSSIAITPSYNRCVLFDPSSKGSEHWVKKLNAKYADKYRYNVTSWYWGV